MEPALGARAPPMIERRVDLPDPLRPTRPTRSVRAGVEPGEERTAVRRGGGKAIQGEKADMRKIPTGWKGVQRFHGGLFVSASRT